MEGSKSCMKCGERKPLAEFYRHPKMADGHLNKCKACTKTDVAAHRAANVEKVRAYDRERSKSRKRVRHASRMAAMWRAEDGRRSAAHSAVARAIRSGLLERKPCVRCGCTNSLAHHESYAKERWLDVMWLCQPCHKERHKELALAGIEP